MNIFEFGLLHEKSMKNKIISAMLIGMSASMAVPGTVAFAATDAAEPTADVQVDEPSHENADAEPEASPESTTPEATPETTPETTPEVTPEVAPETTPESNTDDNSGDSLMGISSMNDYATNEEAKKADTPEDFATKVNEVMLLDDYFGKYVELLYQFISSEDCTKATLYDCEMSIMSHIDEIAVMESSDAINSMKYHVAIAFEDKFGENAFQPGRDVRRAIVTGKDAEFEACKTISDIDNLYKTNGGITTKPSELFGETNPTTTPAPEAPEGSLASHVENIVDLETTLGVGVVVPEIKYDTNYIKEVTVDTSKVNHFAIGEYEIVYNITGITGDVESVKRVCKVVEDNSANELAEEMCKKIDEIAKGELTEKEFQDKWTASAEEAKTKIKALSDEAAMQKIVDEAAETYSKIVLEQQLSIAKKGYVNIINTYMSQLDFKTETQKAMAKEILEDSIDKINSATTVDEAAKALEEGKTKLKAVSEETETSIDELRKKAKESIRTMKNNIKDSTSITSNVYDAFMKRLDSCTTAKEIESVNNSASLVFEDIKMIVSGNVSITGDFLKSLKGISTESDATSTIDLIIGLEPTKDLKEAESRIKDACMALSYSKDVFAKHLSSKAGQEIKGSTKAEMYVEYIKVISENPDKDLEKLKDEARTEIEKILATVDEKYDSIKTRKAEVKEAAERSLALAKDKDEIKKIVDIVKEKADELIKEVEALKDLETLKTKSKEQITLFINEQKDEKLKAQLTEMSKSYTDAIDAAKTEKDVVYQLEAFKKDAEAVIKAYNDDVALAKAKSDALKKLTALEAQANKEFETSDMKQIMEKAKADINAAKTPSDCSNIYAKAKADYSEAYLKGMRAVYAGKVDAIIKDIKFSNQTYADKANEVVNKQKENINQATNEKTMQNCLSLAQKQIDKLVELQVNDQKLVKMKTDAIAQLQALYSNPSDNGRKILESYYNKINAATSADEINKLVDECKSSMTSSGEATGQSQVDELKKAKTDAISALTNMLVNSVPAEHQEAARDVLAEFEEKINSATTVEDVNRLFEEGKLALTKYGGDPNTAIPNTNTSTNVDGGNGNGNGNGAGDASQKGNADVSGTGNVKTGDENIGIIAVAGAAIMSAIGAAVLAIRRFLKK